jgi:hypothetical protein
VDIGLTLSAEVTVERGILHLQARAEICSRLNDHKPPNFGDDLCIDKLAISYDCDVRIPIARVLWPQYPKDLGLILAH